MRVSTTPTESGRIENKVLERLDHMITQHELLLARADLRSENVPEALKAEIKRLETGMYALREGVHGLVRAREHGLPLEKIDSYLATLEGVATQAEHSLLDAIGRLEALPHRRTS
jgi:hypothetical protein